MTRDDELTYLEVLEYVFDGRCVLCVSDGFVEERVWLNEIWVLK